VAEWAVALVDMGRGRWDAALERLEELVRPGPGLSSPMITLMTTPDCVEAAIRCGRVDSARAALSGFERWAIESGAAWARPLLAACRGLVATGDEATRRFDEAAAHATEARPFDRARIHLLHGEHLRRERRRVEAQAELRRAIEGFERLHAAAWVERAQSELRASGQSARRRDASTIGQLTAQELQVADLVAQGLSNKEVAAQLFLSPRTIDAHLRSVFSKLGITSRTQLARLSLLNERVESATQSRRAIASPSPGSGR
jgi:DNA-binding CsgD family transcriptional regulator